MELEMKKRQQTVMDTCHNLGDNEVKHKLQASRRLKVVMKLFIEK
jgi:hypothetical protein